MLNNTENPRGLLLFFREILQNPTAVGAACPSSSKLANSIAQLVPANPDGYIVELGGGTGVITEALLKKGLDPQKLIILERSQPLTQHLTRRFPTLKIIHGDASELDKYLNPTDHPVTAIVSSLPLRSLPKSTVAIIGNQLDYLMKKDNLFIQYTYSLLRQPTPPSTHFQWTRSESIWWNFPPARIDVFRRVT